MSSTSGDLQKEYALRFAHMAQYRDAVWKILIRRFFQEKIGTDQVILDLGSGWGEFINNIQASRKYAMDLNPEARERVSSDVVFLEQDCSAVWDLPDETLDVVFTSNFFEHLPSKQCLLDTLRQSMRCLKPGGRVICMGPNIKYLSNDYWDFFDHYIELSHLSLVEGFKMADFQVTSVIPRFLPYTMADAKSGHYFCYTRICSSQYFGPFSGSNFLSQRKNSRRKEQPQGMAVSWSVESGFSDNRGGYFV
ncbi:MAG: class I SAM-dependent methyltransferase [Verrucomicrobiales bacterium]